MMQSFQTNIDTWNVTMLLKIDCSIFSLYSKEGLSHEQDEMLKEMRGLHSSSLCNLDSGETIHRVLWEAVVRVVAVYTAVLLDWILVPHHHLYKGHIPELMICIFSWHHFPYLAISILRMCPQ